MSTARRANDGSDITHGGELMKRNVLLTLGGALACALCLAPLAFAEPARDAKIESRLQDASAVFADITKIPDRIPQDLIDKARCVVVVPSVLNAAFIVGADYGRGVMVCRSGEHHTGPWGAPAMYALEGGSFGFQIGGEATDYVFLVMNEHGARSLLHSKVKLGADASIAAGPVGRSANADTDAYMRAEILSYSRARGVFAGVSLEGSTLRPDNHANRSLYGRSVTAAQIVQESEVSIPPAGETLVAELLKASPRLRS
jgi:lipid-binding SYLF domain-containing protein